MPVPDFQSFFKPLLEFAADGLEHSYREAKEKLRNSMIPMDGRDFAELLPSVRDTKYISKLAFAQYNYIKENE